MGFASPEIAYAYIGSLLVALLCVIYGLISWKDWGKVMQGRRPRRVRRGKKGVRRRRRR